MDPMFSSTILQFNQKDSESWSKVNVFHSLLKTVQKARRQLK